MQYRIIIFVGILVVSQIATANAVTKIGIGSGALETGATTRGPATTAALSYQWTLNPLLSVQGSYHMFWRNHSAGPIDFLHLTHRLTIDATVAFQNSRLFGSVGVGVSPYLTQIKLNTTNAPESGHLLMGFGGHLGGCAGVMLTPSLGLGLLLEGFNRGALFDANAQVVFRISGES